MTITFKVTIGSKSQGKTITNGAMLENPLDLGNPTMSNVVQTKVSNKLYVPNTGIK
ncbi:MAG: hypothetical protein ACK5LZ_06660 [Anaerorhabdus sp.]